MMSQPDNMVPYAFKIQPFAAFGSARRLHPDRVARRNRNHWSARRLAALGLEPAKSRAQTTVCLNNLKQLQWPG